MNFIIIFKFWKVTLIEYVNRGGPKINDPLIINLQRSLLIHFQVNILQSKSMDGKLLTKDSTVS